MFRISSLLCVGALALGCTNESQTDDDLSQAQGEAGSCAKIEGSDIGQRVTIEVPGIDGAIEVTFTSWTPKDGENNEFVGFTLDVNAVFNVKAGNEVFEGSGSSWANPNGTAGSAAKGISYVEICSADDDDDVPPPIEPPACDGHDCDGGGDDGGDDGGGDDGGGDDGGGDEPCPDDGSDTPCPNDDHPCP